MIRRYCDRCTQECKSEPEPEKPMGWDVAMRMTAVGPTGALVIDEAKALLCVDCLRLFKVTVGAAMAKGSAAPLSFETEKFHPRRE